MSNLNLDKKKIARILIAAMWSATNRSEAGDSRGHGVA